MNLSKSKYCKGVQCPKMLWMDEHLPDFFDDSVMDEGILQTGNEVGDLAMGYFGGFVEIPFDREHMGAMLAETKLLVDADTPIITEATFNYYGNLCMVDILKLADEGVDIIEVKSSTSMKDIYYHDIAYQYWVLSHCELAVRSASLMHIDKGYVRHGELNLRELFAIEDHTLEIVSMQEGVSELIPRLKKTAAQPDEPECEIGARCFVPYECGYRGYCWRNLPSPNVFDIGGVGPKVGDRLLKEGIVSFEDALAHPDRLQARQLRQVSAAVNELPPFIDRAVIAEFLRTLSFPLYFLDFETFMPAIPPFDDAHPFQQIPSQYSLHFLASEDGELQHREFLGREGTDPRRELAERLCGDIPQGVCVLAYNMSFEKRVIADLAALFDDLADRLMGIHANIKDLMVPFASGAFYSRGQQGSYSIKNVLPALCPDDPTLDYHSLDGIHNGAEAMAAFADLPNHPPDEIAIIRAQLLAYCKLDTLAMVRIWEKLNELVRT